MKQDTFDKYFSLAKPFLIPGFHVLVLFTVYKLLVLSSFITPIEIYLLKQWDAYWYASIAEHGYLFNASKPSNSGFFPLFSYEWKTLWKLTGAGIGGVCIFNTLLFFAGMLILKKAFNFSWAYFLVFLSLPSNLFMYVPYSEASFFFFSALILAGLKTDKTSLVLTGLFFSSLTKPTAAFFIPAILAIEWMTFTNFKEFTKRVLGFSLLPILSVLIVVIFQYIHTGVWFAYFKAQSAFWHRTFQLPELPLTTWGGPRILWLDGLAMFFGLIIVFLLIVAIIKRFFKDKKLNVDKATLFSLTYLSLTFFSVLFFNGKDALGGTSLMGANRYLMATPYFVVFLYFISHTLSIQKLFWPVFTFFAFALLFFLKTEGGDFITYTAFDSVIYQIFILMGIGMYVLISVKLNNRFLAAFYLINVFMQIILLHQFAYAKWIG